MNLLLPLTLLAPLDDPPLPAPDRVVVGERERVVEGDIVFVDAERILVRQKSRLKEIERGEVRSYTWVDESLSAVLDRLEMAVHGELGQDDLRALGARCAETNLPGEQQLVQWLVLDRDPADAEARKILGHRPDGDGWRIRVDARWIRDDKLDEMRADWGSAWELASAHFDLRTNLPRAEALRVLVDAEVVYRGFFLVLGPELGLYHPTERLGLHVHGDEASFPLGGDHLAAYQAADRRTVIGAWSGYDPAVLVRRLTAHLFDAAGREMGDKQALPAWAAEGFARLLESTLGVDDPQAQRLTYDPARRNDRLRLLHAGAQDPDDLDRVLQYASGDFYGDDRDLRWAESYTLVEFLLDADEGALRDSFRAFLAGAMQGRGSSTDFKSAIGLKEKDLQARWLAHVGRK